MTSWRTRAFGLDIEGDFPLPGSSPSAGSEAVRVRLEAVEATRLESEWSGTSGSPVWETAIDGRPVSLLSGDRGDHLLRFGQAAFHFDVSGARIRCCGDPDDPRWRRFVLDTVLTTASLLNGYELLRASSVSTPAGPIALVAPSGFGKTSLTLALIQRGHPLFADDTLAFGHGDGGLLCHPGPALMNVPRRRMVGLWRLLADLDEEAWIEVDRPDQLPAPVAAVFMLEPGRPGTARRLQPSPLRLLPHALGFRHLPDRRRSRFEVFEELAATTPIFGLCGAMQAAPSRLADEVERTLERVATGDLLAGIAV